MVKFVKRGISRGQIWSSDTRRVFVSEVHSKLDHYKSQYLQLKETTALLELAMWKNKMNDCCGQQKKTRHSKKMRMDDSAMRKQCRVKCGAETNIVIEHVLPYLDML